VNSSPIKWRKGRICVQSTGTPSSGSFTCMQARTHTHTYTRCTPMKKTHTLNMHIDVCVSDVCVCVCVHVRVCSCVRVCVCVRVVPACAHVKLQVAATATAIIITQRALRASAEHSSCRFARCGFVCTPPVILLYEAFSYWCMRPSSASV
jgi:hypothetical protein